MSTGPGTSRSIGTGMGEARVIDLARGHPSDRLLAVGELQRATGRILTAAAAGEHEHGDRHPLQYGIDLGPLSVRIQLAAWLGRRYDSPNLAHSSAVASSHRSDGGGEANSSGAAGSGDGAEYGAIDPDTLAMTCGASYALMNILAQLLDREVTRSVFMVSPAYFLAARIFQDAGYANDPIGHAAATGGECDGDGERRGNGDGERRNKRVVAIREMPEGSIDFATLERVLQEDHDLKPAGRRSQLAGKRYRHVFYAVPTFSNPSGAVWSLETRRRLLEVARRFDMLIVTDEVYDFLDYRSTPRSTPLPRLVDLDTATLPPGEAWGNTISNMSFSKYLGPGLRCGVVQAATPQLAAQFGAGGANHSGGATAQYMAHLVGEIVASGDIETVLDRLCDTYARRSAAVLQVLKERMPAGTVVTGGDGGYFIWVRLPEGYLPVGDILARAKAGEDGVQVVALPGRTAEVPGDELGWGRRCFRLAVSWHEEEELVEGVQRLAEVVAASKVE